MSCLFNSQLEYQHRFVSQKGMPKFISKIIYCFKNVLRDHHAFKNVHPKGIHDFFSTGKPRDQSSRIPRTYLAGKHLNYAQQW